MSRKRSGPYTVKVIIETETSDPLAPKRERWVLDNIAGANQYTEKVFTSVAIFDPEGNLVATSSSGTLKTSAESQASALAELLKGVNGES